MNPPVIPTSRAAARAAAGWAATPPAVRRDHLHAVADALEDRRAELVALARRETHLTAARLDGELTRTTGQLRLLGDHVADGGHLDLRSSPGGAPDGSDIVTTVVPLGPVAVFAASNFPFAFGVPGGDTASALAAGCPVVVKAHPAQPELSRALAAAVAAAGLPDGVFALVEGGVEASIALVTAPAIAAVGFTGSLRGGRALMDAAAARPDPIPVYAEMGSLNPVFVLPGAAAEPERVAALAAAVTGSGGQLCTKPGLVVVPDTAAGAGFADGLAAAVVAAEAAPLLTPEMLAAHGARAQAVGTVGVRDGVAVPTVHRLPAGKVPGGDDTDEHFGPSTVLAVLPADTFAEVAAGLAGSLTATVLGTVADEPGAVPLVAALAHRAGRVVWNGVPTGVGVCAAMHHGGPWPASGAAWSTSVGPAAVRRFVRPVALQGLPSALLRSLAVGVALSARG